jgi:hypothetical protein
MRLVLISLTTAIALVALLTILALAQPVRRLAPGSCGGGLCTGFVALAPLHVAGGNPGGSGGGNGGG